MDAILTRRLDEAERQLSLLRVEVASIRELADTTAPEPDPAPSVFAWPPEPRVWPAPEPTSKPEPTAEPEPTYVPRPGPLERGLRRFEDVDLTDFLGTRGLAVAGGVVTLLGILFFFVLAVNRGWIGPDVRVLCGGLASAIVFGAGLWVQRRHGETYSALAAVGAGIAGGYATLLAATALYHLLPATAALVAATLIAAAGVATAIAWDSQIVAGIGLVGALLVPAAVLLQSGEPTVVGIAFVAFVLAGTIAVASIQRWGRLLDLAVLASLPQIAAFVISSDAGTRTVLPLATVFWLLYLAAGIAWQRGERSGALQRRSATIVSLTSVYALVVAAGLLDGSQLGAALIAAGAVYVALTVATALTHRLRGLAPILGAAALAIVAIGLAGILSGGSLTAVWAAEAALLAVVASRLRDSRLELGAIVYLALATLHGLILDARPDTLLVRVADADVTDYAHAGHGVPVLLVLAASFAAVAWFSSRPLPEPETPAGALAFTAPALAAFHRSRSRIALVEAMAAGVVALYAAALTILAAFHAWSSGSPVDAFQHSQVAVVGAWALAGLAAAVVGLRTSRRALHWFGLGWLGVTLAYEAVYAIPQLDSGPRCLGALLLAAALLVGALFEQEAEGTEIAPLGALPFAASVALGVYGVVGLVPRETAGIHAQGAALLGLGAVYCVLAAGVYLRGRQRGFSTLLAVAGLGIAAFAASEQTSGTYLVLAWCVAAAALAVTGRLIGESRLASFSGAFVGLALVHTLALEAPLRDLFTVQAHPAAGVLALLLVMAAGAVLAVCAPPGYDRERELGIVAIAILAVYSCSLAILGVAQHLGGGDASAHFQRGQTAVSTFWGLIGVGLLFAGLRQGRRALQLGGFALLGVSLAKIFLFDLPSLSSVTRALSFLGVGALLLLAGFVYQRLATLKT